MKRLCYLLLVCLLSTFAAFAQTHFITAGQAQGMTFTDYIPDYKLPLTTTWNGPFQNETGETGIDFNKDGVVDMTMTYYHSGSNGTDSYETKLLTDTNCFVYCVYDTTNGPACQTHSYKWFAKSILFSTP